MVDNHTDSLRHGQRRAEEVHHVHGAHLSQEAQTLIGDTKPFGLPQLFAQDAGSRRKGFAQFLASGATAADMERVERIGLVLSEPDAVTVKDRVDLLDEGDRQFISEHLIGYNQRLDVVEACTKNLSPEELHGLFAGNPNLERLFTDAGSEPEAIKRALRGAFEWAAAGDEATFRNLYNVLNNFALHKSAEKRLGAVLSEKALKDLAETHHIDMKALRRHIDPAAPRADNIRRVQDFLQESGMGVIKSWIGARKINLVQNIVTYFSEDQEAHLQDAANVCNVLLANDTIYAGAIDEMLKGTSAAPMSPILSKEAYTPGREFVDTAYDRGNNTVGLDVTEAYREQLRAHGMTQNNSPLFQRNFLDHHYDQNIRGQGFLSWLLGRLWGRKRDEIVNNHALDGVTA